jgi:predicted NAD/FAD-dependent oxidoreductase
MALPRVAVVGGGLAGLACASELQGAGIAAHVFDMGSRGPGQLPL